jgi:UPF0755 protein
MSKRSFRIALIVVLATLAAAGVVAGFVTYRALGYPTQRHAGSGAEVKVTIASGMSFPRIAALLAERGVIDDARWFRLYGMHRGVTTSVKTGDYVLSDAMTPEEVLARLLEGVKDVTALVTIPEGINMLEVFAQVAKAGVAPAAELERVARDPAFLAGQAITGDTVEGYLFPESYRFKVPSKPEAVIETMIKQHRIVWERVSKAHEPGIARLRERLGWSDREILIMASIVEKEAVLDAERPRIAQVFINRLIAPGFSPRRLETDPTIRYGCTVPLEKSAGCKAWTVTDRLRRAQLDDADNLYNTYQHEGLPPGPIANPGERSLVATVDADGSDFFYFVAKDDHSHWFAKTFDEHKRNVQRYLKRTAP